MMEQNHLADGSFKNVHWSKQNYDVIQQSVILRL